jgi:hypothetical protein
MHKPEPFMQTVIIVKETNSGEDKDILWIGLHFNSVLSKEDWLLIVCGKEVDDQDKSLGMDSLYFERLDQAYSCYGAAKLIRPALGGVEIHFTSQGSKILEFPAEVIFDCTDITENWQTTRKTLEKMAGYKWAGSIKPA